MGPKFTKDEPRYYPWFHLYTKKEYDQMDEEKKRRCVLRSGCSTSSYCGCVHVSAINGSSYSSGNYGSQFAFKTRELAEYAGKQFIDIYTDFTDFLGMANAAMGGDRQVEYTDGGMSGKAYIDNNGNVVWNATDKTSWSFDPGHEEKLKSQIREGSPGSLLRFVMGKADEQYNTNPVTQNLTVTFPADTISGIARYSTVPKIKQKK